MKYTNMKVLLSALFENLISYTNPKTTASLVSEILIQVFQHSSLIKTKDIIHFH